MEDDLLRQRARRVVGAGVLPRWRLDDDEAADRDDEWDVAKVAPDEVAPTDEGRPTVPSSPAATGVSSRTSSARSSPTGSLSMQLGQCGGGLAGGGRLVVLDPGDERSGELLGVATVVVVQVVEGGERDLGLFAVLADQAEDDVVGDLGAGVAEQAFVDVADLLDVDRRGRRSVAARPWRRPSAPIPGRAASPGRTPCSRSPRSSVACSQGKRSGSSSDPP